MTKHFSIRELTKTNTGLPNNPSPKELESLKILCERVLEPLRKIYNKPIYINSGYRGPAVNKVVGGVPTSQHSLGEAADITTRSKSENKILFNIIKNELEYDQLIDEYDFRWVHVSYTTRYKNRKQILKIG